MDDLAYYQRQSAVTDPGAERHLFTSLPADVASMATLLGGLMVHRDWTWRFGFDLPWERREEANTRYVSAILHHLGSLEPRPPSERFAGTCRDFTVVLCAMLRATGIPARARAGFAGYFTDGFFDDHWVVETWDGHSWRLVDAQVASAPKGTYTDADIDFLDVPRSAFLVGGQAWRECRTGRRDPTTIGTSAAGLTGLWEVQGNVIRDLANLNLVETLPWDTWGLIPTHYDNLPPEDVALLDRIAQVSASGGPQPEAAAAYNSDPRLPVVV
ncbi:transglutaminase-like domain-containing protein [Kibdelosporangium lantanae]